MKEAEFQRNVVELARRLGFLVHHCRPGRTSGGKWVTPITGDAGFPDLVLVGSGRLVFLELKSDAGTVTADQKRWGLELLRVSSLASPVEYLVVRPSDIQEIAEVLSPRRSGKETR